MTDVLDHVDITEDAQKAWTAIAERLAETIIHNGYDPSDIGEERAYVEGDSLMVYLDLPDGTRVLFEVRADQWRWNQSVN